MSDECICGDISARNCPIHQGGATDDNRPREWWIYKTGKQTYASRQALPNNVQEKVRVIEYSAVVERDALLTKLVSALEMIAHNEAPEENTGGVSKGLAKAALAEVAEWKAGK